jgi:excisionase family DNA binding protein
MGLRVMTNEKNNARRVSTDCNELPTELLTPEELASYLKVSPSTVYNWAKTGKIDCFVLSQGKRKSTVRFAKKHISDFIQKRMGGSSS